MFMIEQGTIFGGWEEHRPKSKAEPEPVPNRANLREELQSGHLPMFMTGPEIKEHYAPNESDKNPKPGNMWENEDDHELWSRKLKEAKQTGVERYGKDSFERDRTGAWRSLIGPTLARQGVGPNSSIESVSRDTGAPQGFVSLATGVEGPGNRPQILGGHHRVALAAEQFKGHLFPVKHFDSIKEAKKERGYR